MVHVHTVPVCTTVVGPHTVVVLVLRNSLSVCVLVSSMMRMLLLVMTLLLLVPRWLSLRVLLLVREDMLRVDHFEGRRVIRQRSDLIFLGLQLLSGDEYRDKRNIIETLEASEVRSSNEELLQPEVDAGFRCRLLFAGRLTVVRRRSKMQRERLVAGD